MKSVAVLSFVAYFAVALAALYGYVVNIIDIVQLVLSNAPFGTLFFGRVVGLFVAPLGAVLGYF